MVACYALWVPFRARRSPRALALSLGACWVALAVPQGCGAPDRPSTLDNYVPTPSQRGDPGPSGPLVVGGAATVPMCNIGPEGGVCACADEPLVGDVPNIYFVLDRSDSMNEMSKWANVQVVLENLIVSLGPRASVGAAVFPNPGADGCATGVELFSPRRGDAPAGTPGPIEAQLITAINQTTARGGTPTASTLTALLPRLTSLPGKTYVILATDGGPNCDPTAHCMADQCTVNLDGACPAPPTPAGPANCCTLDLYGGAENCLDAQPTVDAVAQIAQAGIPVYVVGVPGSAPYATLLDKLAVAGGTARASEPQYYAIDSADQAALQSVLSGIAAKITGSCTLSLDNVPASPGLVNVFFDERVLPQGGPDGWTLDGTTVTISGASCQMIHDGDVLDVRVVAGCPTVTF